MNDRNNQNQGSFEQMGEQLGQAAGRAMGRGTEMAMGAMTSMLSSTMNAMGQWWSTADAATAAQSFDDTRDQTCREHFQSSASSPMSTPAPTSTTRSYEDVRPLYQFGHTASHNPAYQGRSFDEIEADLQRAWDEERSSSYGDWPEIRGYVGFGYQDPTRMPRDF